MLPRIQTLEIAKDTILRRNVTGLTFVINGTWQVEIDGLLYMPGQNGAIEFRSGAAFAAELPIRFVADKSGDPSVSSNPNLKNGKFVHLKILPIS